MTTGVCRRVKEDAAVAVVFVKGHTQRHRHGLLQLPTPVELLNEQQQQQCTDSVTIIRALTFHSKHIGGSSSESVTDCLMCHPKCRQVVKDCPLSQRLPEKLPARKASKKKKKLSIC